MFFKTFAEKERERKGARYDADMRKARSRANSAGMRRCDCNSCRVPGQSAQDVPNRLYGATVNHEGDAV